MKITKLNSDTYLNKVKTLVQETVAREKKEYKKYYKIFSDKESKILTSPYEGYPCLLELYERAFSLCLKINLLYPYLEQLEKENYNENIGEYNSAENTSENLDDMMELNSLIYKNLHYYKKSIVDIKYVITQRIQIWDIDTSNFYDTDLYVKNIKRFFSHSGVDVERFDILIENDERTYTNILKKMWDRSNSATYQLREGREENSFDFHLPIPKLNPYLLTREMVDGIKNGWANKPLKDKNLGNKIDSTTTKNKRDSVYLVNFNALKSFNKSTNTFENTGLVYSYTEYNEIFEHYIVNYLESITGYNIFQFNVDNTLFIIDDKLKKYSTWDSEKWNQFRNSNEDCLIKSYKTKRLNITQFLLILSPCGPLYLKTKDTAGIIHNLYELNNIPIIEKYYKYNETEELVTTYIDEDVIKHYINSKKKSNIIFNYMFLVTDLENLLKKIKELNIIVSGGPQSDRARCSLLDYKLSIIDHSIRRSMFVSSQKIPGLQPELKNKDFSFKNIHINLGKVRW